MTNGYAVLLTGIPEAATHNRDLCFVSHCCDNVTRSLSTDVDTGSSADEYDWEDVTYNTPSPITTSSNVTAATALSLIHI